jgi:hypothetical protein
MATSLRSEKVVKQWGTVVERGAGRDKWVLDTTETLIKEVSPPAVVTKRESVTSGGMFSEKRDFLIVTHNTLREYAMFIGAQNFGKDLAVAWYLTVNPGFLKRAISKKLTNGDPNALSGVLPVFAQQDLSSYMHMAHSRLKEAVGILLDEMQQDTARIDWSPKGFLSIW